MLEIWREQNEKCVKMKPRNAGKKNRRICLLADQPEFTSTTHYQLLLTTGIPSICFGLFSIFFLSSFPNPMMIMMKDDHDER